MSIEPRRAGEAGRAGRPTGDGQPPIAVAIVRARYNPYGGAERFVQRALSALSHEGVALTVVARDWQSSPGGEAPAGMRLQKIDPFYVGKIWRDASFARSVGKYLSDAEFDMVQSHERIAGLPIYRAGDGVHAEYLAQRLKSATGWRRTALQMNPWHRYTCDNERRMFQHKALRAVICNSKMVREEILQHFAVDPAKLHLIRNGVDTERYAPPTDVQRAEARANLGLAPQRKVFAFVGSGFERKGLANAIRALADPAAPADSVLVVVGDDRRARSYRRLADTLGVGERVEFAGSLVDVRPVLHAADGFVLPTIYDPFPNAVLEALACGLPVITSTKCGAGELISAGRNGFVGDAQDSSAIAHQMSAVVANPQMRAAARESALPHTLKNLAGELLALYRTLAPATLRKAPRH